MVAALRPGFAARKSKFGNVRTEVDGITYDSAKESRRHAELKLLERAGEVTDLRRQVRFPLSVGKHLIGHIIPDFTYREKGVLVCEDVKSDATITPIFKWKAKHFAAQYGFEIRVVK